MSDEKPLEAFTEALLDTDVIATFLREHYGKTTEARMQQFRAGDADDFIDLLQDNLMELAGEPVLEIEATGPEDDTFEICIWSLGSIYWITANEFDMIGFFSSLQDAGEHALSRFDGYISTLAERRHGRVSTEQ